MIRGRGGAYRDAGDATRSRVDELRREVAERIARVKGDLMAALPGPLGERVRTLAASASASADTPEAQRRLMESLEALRDALDEAIRIAPELEATCRELPEEAPELPVRERRWALALALPGAKRRLAREVGGLWGKLKRIVLKEDPSAELTWTIHAFRGRFHAAGEPFSIVAEIRELDRDPLEVDMAVATSVARAAPRMSVEPTSWTDSFLGAFVSRRDASVGDDGFDSLFRIDADERDARRVLTADVRAALLAIGHYDLPQLTVGDGQAVLRWRFEPQARAIQAAVSALSRVRRAPLRLEWLVDD